MVLDCWTCWTQSAMVSRGAGRIPITCLREWHVRCIWDIREPSKNPNISKYKGFHRIEVHKTHSQDKSERALSTSHSSHLNCDERVAKDPQKNCQCTPCHYQRRTIRISHSDITRPLQDSERRPKVRGESCERGVPWNISLYVQASYTIVDIPDHSCSLLRCGTGIQHGGTIWPCWGLNPVWSWQDGRPQILNGWDCCWGWR